MEEPVPYEKDTNFVGIDENLSRDEHIQDHLKSFVENEGVLLDDDYYHSNYTASSKLYIIPSSYKIIIELKSGRYEVGECCLHIKYSRYKDKIEALITR